MIMLWSLFLVIIVQSWYWFKYHSFIFERHKNFQLNNEAVLELEDVKHKEKLTWQAFSELHFTLSSADFQINSESGRYYVGALKKTHSNLLCIPVAEQGVKITDFMCFKFLTSSVASILLIKKTLLLHKLMHYYQYHLKERL